MHKDNRTPFDRLREKDTVQERFLVAEKQLAFTREGKAYLKLALMTRAGRIEGILWENAEAESQRFSQGDVIEVQGTVVLYQGERKIRLQRISTPNPDGVRKEDYLPCSSRSYEEMEGELNRTVRKVKNPFLRHLLEAIFRDPVIWKAYRCAPAAKSVHHAYLGGLLEHTLSLARLVGLATQNYPFLDADLVLAGALVHDLGKAWELCPELGFEYTNEGRLLGHIVIGLEILEKKIREVPDFPAPLAMHLKHIVASHHGELEFGSPKQPQTLEALCLHALDNLDAKLCGVHQFVQREIRDTERWTSFHRVHERYFYVPEPVARGGATVKDAPEPAAEEETPDLFGG
ncbi:MAG: HD domain-containing protein [bacterium]